MTTNENVNIKLTIDPGKSASSLGGLETHLQTLRDKIKNVGLGSADFKKLQKEIVATDTKLKNATKSLEGVDTEKLSGELSKAVGGVAALAGAFTLMGSDGSDSMVELQAKLQKSLMLVMAFKGATEIATSATNLWKSAQIALNTAMESNPIGLIAAAIALLVVGMIKLVKNMEQARQETLLLNEESKELIKTQEKEISNLKVLFDELENTTIGTQNRKDAVEKLNKEYPDLLTNVDLEKASLDDLNIVYENNIQLMRDRGIEIALVGQKEELYIEKIDILTEVTRGFLNEFEVMTQFEGKDVATLAARLVGDVDGFSGTTSEFLDFLRNQLREYSQEMNVVLTDAQINNYANMLFKATTYGFNGSKSILNDLTDIGNQIERIDSLQGVMGGSNNGIFGDSEISGDYSPIGGNVTSTGTTTGSGAVSKAMTLDDINEMINRENISAEDLIKAYNLRINWYKKLRNVADISKSEYDEYTKYITDDTNTLKEMVVEKSVEELEADLRILENGEKTVLNLKAQLKIQEQIQVQYKKIDDEKLDIVDNEIESLKNQIIKQTEIDKLNKAISDAKEKQNNLTSEYNINKTLVNSLGGDAATLAQLNLEYLNDKRAVLVEQYHALSVGGGTKEQLAAVVADISTIDEKLKATVEDNKGWLTEILGLGDDGELEAILDSSLNLIGTITDAYFQIMENKSDAYYKKRYDDLESSLETELALYEDNEEQQAIIQAKFDAEYEALEREEFERNKDNAKAQIAIQTALAIVNTWASYMKMEQPLGAILAGIQTAGLGVLAGVQIDAVNKSTYARGGMLYGNSHNNGGVQVEAEGGESIINKRSTAMYGDILSKINQAGGGVAINSNTNNNSGSLIDYDLLASKINDKKVYVVSSDISTVQKKDSKVKIRSKF